MVAAGLVRSSRSANPGGQSRCPAAAKPADKKPRLTPAGRQNGSRLQTAGAAAKDSGSSWWPFGSDHCEERRPRSLKKKPLSPLLQRQASSGKNWWWPFGGDCQGRQAGCRSVSMPMPDPKVTQAWLDEYEPRLRAAIKDTNLQLERREKPAGDRGVCGQLRSRPPRPDLLMPSMLGPFTRVAKVVEGDPKTAVLVLGHADSSGAMAANTKLSLDRAQVRWRRSSA
jgi:hypothetical protein